MAMLRKPKVQAVAYLLTKCHQT